MTELVRQEIATTARTLVVKVGTRVLTDATGRLDQDQIEQLGRQIHQALESDRRVVLVSSGAVGAGMGRLGLAGRPTDLAHLQAVAAVGQSVLVEAYERTLHHHGHHAAQILLTADDLNQRTRYLNARNTILKLLELGAVPVINENDTVAVDELQTTFGDNDHLAAMVTNLIQAPLLVLLSDVEGVFDGDPEEPGSQLIPTITRLDRSVFDLARDHRGGMSKGGMASKLQAARLATRGGENVIIASGRQPDVISRIIRGDQVGTLILAQGQTLAARKRWIGFTARPRGQLTLDAGARGAVEAKGRSLLAIGVTGVTGRFNKGDVVALRDGAGEEFARGLSNYPSEELARIIGRKTGEIAQILGHCPYDEVIHRDNMVLTR